jgi:WD40 repeat protein
LHGLSANVRALASSPSDGLLASGDEDSVAKLWTMSASPGRENALPHFGIVNRLAFAPDGRTLVTTDPNVDTLRLWKVTTQRDAHGLRDYLSNPACAWGVGWLD